MGDAAPRRVCCLVLLCDTFGPFSASEVEHALGGIFSSLVVVLLFLLIGCRRLGFVVF
jgi:hypothetical protein